MWATMRGASLDNDNEMKGELICAPCPHMGSGRRMLTAPDFGWPDMKSFRRVGGDKRD